MADQLAKFKEKTFRLTKVAITFLIKKIEETGVSESPNFNELEESLA